MSCPPCARATDAAFLSHPPALMGRLFTFPAADSFPASLRILFIRPAGLFAKGKNSHRPLCARGGAPKAAKPPCPAGRGRLPRLRRCGPLPCAARRSLFSPLPFGKAKPAPAFGPSKAPTTPLRCKKPLEIPFLSHRALGFFASQHKKKGGPGAPGAHRGPPSRRLVCLPPFFKGGSDRAGDLAPRSPSDCRKGP